MRVLHWRQTFLINTLMCKQLHEGPYKSHRLNRDPPVTRASHPNPPTIL